MKLRLSTYQETLIIECERFTIEPFTQDNSVRLMVRIIDINLRRRYYVATSVELV